MAWYRSDEGRAQPKKMGRSPERAKQCVVSDCGRDAVARGMCHMHWRRKQRTGETELPSTEDAFFAKVNESEAGCWEFSSLNANGYGTWQVEGRRVLAHRWAFTHLVGPIPDGLGLDHLCRNRACVNPGHLEPVTQRVNTLRGEGPAARNSAKTECLRGHPFTPENTYVTPDGRRMCRTCSAERSARSRRRKK